MNFLKKYPLFLFLLPLFFVFHGYVENYASIPLKNAFLLVLVYAASAILMASIFFWFYKDFTKAAFVSFIFLAFNFFFGAVQDLLKKNFEGSFFARYVFLLPLSLVLIIFFLLWIRRKNSALKKLVPFLNLLFLILLLIDLVWLVRISWYEGKREANTSFIFKNCDSCLRTDIYFILLDGYSGNNTLKRKFDFDNSDFENGLRNKGFYVATNSHSNYNYTPFSLASMLNMKYLDLNMKTKGPGNLNYSYQMIRESSVVKILTAGNYKFYNYSIFDFKGQPAIHPDAFLSTRTKLITSQTFISRIWSDIVLNVQTGNLKIRLILKKIVYSHLHNNNEYISLTKKISNTSERPKFVYTHLMMPHYPYYFNAKGDALPLDSLVEGKQYSEINYIEYLQYCNGRIIELCDSIFRASSTPPVIILTGDHGFRFSDKQVNKQYVFNNLCAVYLPSGNYTAFYDSISSVNLFPVLLNTVFKQGIPVQKDSTIYLWE